MNAWFRVLFILALLAATPLHAQFPAQCDSRKECVGQAVYLAEPSGRTTHFVDIDGQAVKPRQTALTVEMWVKLERQAGKRVFVAGYWGPNADANDQWLLYVDENDQLSFAVSPEGSNLQELDNTIVRSSATALYGSWNHVAATFDGTTASVSLFINGVRTGPAVSNAQYPCNALRPGTRNDLTTQFGSCNALADNPTLFRAVKGMLDEIRIWNRVVADIDVLCNKDKSLNGNEPGLTLYYRCNEPVGNVVGLCDATGNGYAGILRSGASNVKSDRIPPRTITAVPAIIDDVVKCDTTRTWIINVTDTNICGSTAQVLIRGPERSLFTVTPANVSFIPGVPVSITVTYTGTNVGPFIDTVEVRPSNRCGLPSTFIPMKLRRITQLGLSKALIRYDTLYVGCRERSYIDSTITICNTSDSLGSGTGKPVTIQRYQSTDPGLELLSPTLPLTLPVGACTTFTVRCHVRDTTDDYVDSLFIYSTDTCQKTPMTITTISRSQEVIILQSSGGGRLPDTLSFPPTCPGQSSTPKNYTWQNLTLAPVNVDTVIVPSDFTHYRMTYPQVLQPKTGYDPIAIRFKPTSPGRKFDSIIIRSMIQGCTIEKVIYVTGRGLDNKVEWSISNLVDFGNVFVGQQRTINVVARNKSDLDTLNVSLYVERGDAFTLLAGTGRRIPPADSVTIPVTFRPTDSLEYNDRLCLFETRCFTVDCIPLRGKGVFQTFRFNPLILEIENVVACGSREDTVYIVNTSSLPQTITDLKFANPTGKFTAVSPTLPWGDRTIPAGDSVMFVFRYVPNDVTVDRADRAYINYTSSDNADWQLQVVGTSATPKLFITSMTAFGTVEAGDVKRATLVLENTSGLDVKVDSLTIGPGFTIVSTSRTLPLVLSPRDSMAIVVEFAPIASASYAADITAYSDTPCDITAVGKLTGRGVIIALESALSIVNFGYVRPCECVIRTIELFNGSGKFDMIVDDIIIDSTGVPGGRPSFFTWTSKFSPAGTVPYTIPPTERDTITIRFCPNTPADTTRLEVMAAIHVKAHGSQWTKELETFLYGKRSLTFKPKPDLLQFPSGVIDVMSGPLSVDVSVPDFLTNPTQDIVTIDSITFVPNDRVFFVTAPVTFPQSIAPGNFIQIDVRQRPRAPRDYEARMVIHYSKPCKGMDTTVLVRGSGFAQPRGIAFSFEPARIQIDTFGMISCDTLVLPVYSSIAIDASVVNIMFRMTYDSTQIRLLDIQSALLSNSCTSKTGGIVYTPSVEIDTDYTGGTHYITLHNMCGIDSISPFMSLRFVTTNNNRANTPVVIDSIDFDTEDVILYKLIATPEEGVIIAQKSEIDLRTGAVYDSVRVLDCVDRSVTIFNVGDVPNTLDSLIQLPPYVSVLSAVPPLGSSIPAGDSCTVVLRFCPGRESRIDTLFAAVSATPCDTRDTNAITGYGYSPEVDIEFGAMRTFYLRDTLGGAIGDTIEIPVMLEKDINASYHGDTYWLNGLHFDVDVEYNPRALKYIDAGGFTEPNMSVNNPVHGLATIRIDGTDTVKAGELARLRFLVTVPDSIQTNIHVSARDFVTDSLPFIDIVPGPLNTPFNTSASCAITALKYSNVANASLALYPNPVSDVATITFQMLEHVPVTCYIVDANGMTIATLLDGSTTLTSGSYAIKFSTLPYQSGMYHIHIQAGIFISSLPMMIVR